MYIIKLCSADDHPNFHTAENETTDTEQKNRCQRCNAKCSSLSLNSLKPTQYTGYSPYEASIHNPVSQHRLTMLYIGLDGMPSMWPPSVLTATFKEKMLG